MMNIAQNIISKCGGPTIVAKMVGIDLSQVYRWTYPRNRGGTNGLIPAQHQQTLLREAHRHGIDLSPDDFFDAAMAEDGGK